jgi:hypothetical protein
VSGLVSPVGLYVVPNPKLSERVAKILPEPLREVSTHLCTTDK